MVLGGLTELWVSHSPSQPSEAGHRAVVPSALRGVPGNELIIHPSSMQDSGPQFPPAAEVVYVGLSQELVFYPLPSRNGWWVKSQWDPVGGWVSTPTWQQWDSTRWWKWEAISTPLSSTPGHIGSSGELNPQTPLAPMRMTKAVRGRAAQCSTPGHTQLPTSVSEGHGGELSLHPCVASMKQNEVVLNGASGDTLISYPLVTAFSALFQLSSPFQMFPSAPK